MAKAAGSVEDIEDVDELDLIMLAIRILVDAHTGKHWDVGVAGCFEGANACANRMIGVAPASSRADAALEARADATLHLLPREVQVTREDVIDLFERLDCNLLGVPGRVDEVAALACFVGHFHLFNHACYPNVVFDTAQHSVGPTGDGGAPAFAMYAFEDVKAGDELLLAYRRASDDERHDLFLDHYGFRCTCPLCKGPQTVASALREREVARSCPAEECGGGFGVPIDGGGDGRRLRCVVCNHSWALAGQSPPQVLGPAQ